MGSVTPPVDGQFGEYCVDLDAELTDSARVAIMSPFAVCC